MLLATKRRKFIYVKKRDLHHTSTPPAPSIFEGKLLVLLAQKDQNVGSFDSPHTPHRPRRGVRNIVSFSFILKQFLLNYIFCNLPSDLFRTFASGSVLKTVCQQRKLMQTVFSPISKKYSSTLRCAHG